MTLLAAVSIAAAIAPVQAAAAAPDLAGVWEGRISVGGQSIRIVFRVDAAGNAVMDSPDQGARNIAVDRPTVEGGVVRFVVPVIGGRFEGARSGDGQTLTGTLSQGGATLPLVLTRTAATATLAARPQTPVPPFPYRSEPVAFDNPAAPGVRLAGTLTLPEGAGPFPAAILVTGTGPQDRDETIEGHRSFAIWADALTRRGVAVLRYDDRGVAGSTGNFGAATGVDFASDVRAVFDGLVARPDIDPARVGLIGHSEGAVFSYLAMDDGLRPAWLVTLAGPAVSGAEIITEQSRLIATASGAPAEAVESMVARQRLLMAAIVANADDGEAVRREVEAVALASGAPPEAATRTAGVMSNAWYRGYVAYDPGDSIRAIRVPLLAVYGGKDLQVPADQNAPVVSRLRPDAEVVVLPGLNHLFQPAETGLMAEYGQIETTLDPSVIRTVVDWVAARSGVRP
jgi:pimeloyl-ACP methyl ester carboxylesterase